MATAHTSPRLILDKCFLQGEPNGSPNLQRLCNAGCTIVITDTLLFEMASDTRIRWEVFCSELYPCAHHIEVWRHVSDLMREEIRLNRPATCFVDAECTVRFNNVLSNSEPPPCPSEDEINHFRQQRERNTPDSARRMFDTDIERIHSLNNNFLPPFINLSEDETNSTCRSFVNNERLIVLPMGLKPSPSGDPSGFINLFLQSAVNGERRTGLAPHGI